MVLTLDVSGAVVEKHAIDASYDTVTFNSGIIKQVRWVPGSDVHLCIVSDSSIKIFDFTLEGGHATHSFLTSAADPTVIDATLVPKVKEAGDLNVPGKSSFNAVLVVMTKSCKLFALPLEAPGDDDDNDGILESRIEAGQTLLLPDEYASVEEGIMAMHYSESFGYLLISYEDETVVAVKLNPEVTHIERAFPLFTTAILATCSSIEEASIPSSTGPYNRFVDCPGLEMVLMVARVNRQRTERVVALRVAEDRQRNSLQVQQPRWRVNQDVMGGPSHTSSLLTPGMIEGMCGGPLAMNTTAGGVRSMPPTVLVLYENGSMQIFSDRDLYGVPKFSKPCGVEGMTMATNGPSLSSCITHLINNHAGRFGAGQTISEPSICTAVAIPDVEWEELEDAICMQVPHVTALESLINVTHWKDLMIYAEPFSSFTPEHLRQKLNQDNDEFVVSPRSEGFSMGLRLKSNEMELAAIRILVGNTSLEFIPRELRVMGRTCATCKGLRRWYDLLLSEEEIRLVRETGLLAFSISNSFEHDNPAIIDALEVYARRRSPIANTSPSTWHGERDKMVVKTMITDGGLDDATRLERSVVGCTQVLQEACRAVGPSGLSESMRSQILAPLSLAIGKTLATKYLSEENMKPSQRRARAVRAAAKKVLTCLLPSPGQYQRLKDSIHLENCKMILTSPSQLASSEDLQVSVCVGLKIMSKRPENMLGKDGILLEGLAPYCLESMLGIIRSGIEGLSTMTTVEQLVGDVTELGLREISYRIEANSDIAVIREVLPYLMLLTDSCEQVSSACAVRLIHILNAPSFILSPPAKNAFGNSKVTSAVVDPLTLPQPELSPAEDCIGNEVEYRCDGCDKYPLQNFRWHCKVCEDFDLCETCHGDPDASWDESVGHMPTHGMTRLEIGNALERPSNVTAVSTGAVDGEPQSRTAPMDVESDVRKDSAYKELKSAGCSLVDNLWAAVYECVLMRLQEFLNTSPQQEVWRPQQMVNHLNVAMALATDNARFERLCPLKDILGILAQGFCFHVKQLHQEVETEGRSGNLISRSPRTDWVILLTKTIECLHSLLAQRAKQSIRERSKYLRKAPNCRDHKAPTCLRIWPRGKHQGRRFYMCSLPKESRCSYFRWLDKGTSQGGASCDGDVALALIIGFSETLVSSSGPKAESKGVSVERLLSDLVRWGLSSQSARTNSLDVQRSVSADLDLRTTWPRPSLPSSMESHQKQWAQLELMLDDPSATIRTSVLSLLAASLKVLRRAREKNSQDDPQKQPAIPFSSDWIRLLCDIIGRQDDGVVRQMAKKVLRLLCASRTEYQRVRDLHLFSRSLLSILKTPEVRANAGRLSVSKLRYEIQLHLYSTLSAMCKVAESRRGSWRAFCCHPRFPLVGSANDVDITSVPPISYVYDLCLSLEDGELHSRFLRLLEVGTSPVEIGEDIILVTGVDGVDDDEGEDDEDEDDEDDEGEGENSVEAGEADVKGIEDGGDEDRMDVCQESDFEEAVEESSGPMENENIAQQQVEENCVGDKGDRPGGALSILARESRLNAQNFIRLAVEVLAGSAHADTRATCGKVLRRMWDQISSAQRAAVVEAIPSRMGFVLRQGKHSVEFFSLLSLVCRSPDLQAIIQNPLNELGRRLVPILVKQLELLECHPLGGLYAVLESLLESPTYFLDGRPCPACLKTAPAPSLSPKTSGTGNSATGNSGEHVFKTSTLESLKSAQRSTETTHIFLLKSRQRIRRLSVKIHEPHGRFVKRIILSCHSGTVSSINDLQLPENHHKWERVGAINLTPGQISAELDLAVPIVTGCLLLEYEEFHPAAASGKVVNVIQCPQCGRQVTDAHGVCRHCGEVAFQCRHCRHINYERFDAFLCVECGYCAYGQFSYRVQAALAQSAWPIHSQEDEDSLLALYASQAKELQHEREKLDLAVVELRKRMRELESFMGTTEGIAATFSPSCPELSDAMTLMVSNLSDGIPGDIMNILNGRLRVKSPDDGDDGSVIDGTRIAKFVFVNENGVDMEVDSRDDDGDDDVEDDIEDDLAGMATQASTTSTRAPNVGASGAASAAGGNVSADMEISTFERILAGISAGPSTATAARSAATGNSGASPPVAPFPAGTTASTESRGSRRNPAPGSTPLSGTRLSGTSTPSAPNHQFQDNCGPQSATSMSKDDRDPPSLSTFNARQQIWSAPAALAARQAVLDYYNKNVKSIHDKIMSRSREMTAISEEIFAYQRMLMASSGNPLLTTALEDEDDVLPATCCYQCSRHVALGLTKVLLSVLTKKDGALALIEVGVVRHLTGSWLQSRHLALRHNTRQALQTLCLTCPDEAIPRVHKAIVEQFCAVLMASLPPLQLASHRSVLRNLMDVVADLCTADLPPEVSQEDRKILRPARLRAWAMHLSLPLIFIRSAAVICNSSKEMTDEVVLPCLQILTAAATGLYPLPGEDGDEESRHALEAGKSLMNRVMADFLRRPPLPLPFSTGLDWVTVDHESSRATLRRFLRVITRGRTKDNSSRTSPPATESPPSEERPKENRAWLATLLTNPYSLEVRRSAALLLLHGIPTDGEEEVNREMGDNKTKSAAEDDNIEKGEDADDSGCDDDHDDDDEDDDHIDDDLAHGEDCGKDTSVNIPWGVSVTKAIDMLMMAVATIQRQGEVTVREVASMQVLAILQYFFRCPKNAAFCVARGGIPFLCDAVENEISRLRRDEARALHGCHWDNGSGEKGSLLKYLTALLSTLLTHSSVRAVALRRHMTGMMRVLLALKHSLVLRSMTIEGAFSGLQTVLSRPASEDAAGRLGHQRAFLRAVVEVLPTIGTNFNLCLEENQARLFLLEQMYETISPPQSQFKYRVHLRRAPSQEEFFRGSLSKNPVWSTDIPRTQGQDQHHEIRDGSESEVTVRDLRVMIARDLGIADTTELLELLVTGKILSMDLPLRLVFEKIWRPFVAERHPDEYGDPDTSPEVLPSMLVTYRLAGVDGEATEEVVESLSHYSEGEDAADPNEKYRATDILGENKAGFTLFLSLARPPTSSSVQTIVWEVCAFATKILRLSCKIKENRGMLLALNAPEILLTQLLLVLGCTSKVSLVSTVTLNLLQILEELGEENEGAAAVECWATPEAMDVEEEGDDDKVTAFMDGLSEPSLVQALLKSPSLSKAVGRLLPSLTLGKRKASKALADRVLVEIDWAKVDIMSDDTVELERPERLRLTVLLESLAGLAEGSGRTAQNSSSLGMLRDLLLDNGFTSNVISSVNRGLPDIGIRQCVMKCATRADYLREKDKVEKQWQQYLQRPSLVYSLRVLRGLCQSHLRTQETLVSAGLLPVLHDIEEITSSGVAGSLAEMMLESISEQNPSAAVSVAELRRQTRQQKRRLAQQNRNRALQKIGIKPAPSTVDITSAAAAASGNSSSGDGVGGDQAAGPSNEAASSSSLMLSQTDAARIPTALAPSMGEKNDQKIQGPGVAAPTPKWLLEMEALVEESGHTCMVCQEGYTCKPKEALGIYVHTKAIQGQDLAVLEGDTLGTGTSSGMRSLSSLSDHPTTTISTDPYRLLVDTVGVGLSRPVSSRRSCKVVTTVTAFNLIHFSCHSEAVRADRALKQPKSEWDGASLRNSRVSCNGMLPLRGPKSMDEAYRLAVEKHFSRMSSLGVGQHSPVGRFGLVVHDLRLLLLRLAWQESLREDCGGGSLRR